MARQISVREAAERLGVSPHRVRQRIEDGSLPAQRVGNRWGIDEADLLPLLDGGKVGRPLSERSAWAILDYTDWSPEARGALELLAPSERQRAKQRWSSLTTHAWDTDATADVARLLRQMLGKRAKRHVFRANNRDLPDLRAEVRLVLSGLSDSRAEIAAADIVEGYVIPADLQRLISDYLLTPATDESSRKQANVVFHASHRSVRPPVPVLLTAADLADHRTPREESRAVEILNELTITEQMWHNIRGEE